MEKFNELSERLGYKFRDMDLLGQAFRHSSYVNEQPDSALKDNERLEFLGDAVLDLGVSHILMELFNDAEEGVLSKFRAMIVDEAGLYVIAESLNLGEFLMLGKGEERSRGREKPSILSDTVEALLGAIYLDAGFERTLEIIGRLFSTQLKALGKAKTGRDFKSLLQEHTQQLYKVLPRYRLLEETGPAHDRRFKIALSINDDIISEGEGKSKKEAEQKAAETAYFCLKEI